MSDWGVKHYSKFAEAMKLVRLYTGAFVHVKAACGRNLDYMSLTSSPIKVNCKRCLAQERNYGW